MGEIREKIIFDDSDVIKGLNQQLDLSSKVDKALRLVEMSYKEAFDIAKSQLDETNKAVSDGTKTIGDHITATAKAKKEASGWGSVLHDVANEINVMGTNVGSLVTNLKNKANAMKTVVTAVSAGSKALNVFKIALISTGVGALVVALGSLVTFLAKSEKATKVVSQVMAGLGAAINVITDRIALFGGAIVKVFQGDFKGAFADAKASVSGLTVEIVAAASAAAALEKQFQDLEAATKALEVTNAKRAVQIQQLTQIINDQTKSYGERLKAAKEADAVEAQSHKDLVANAEERFNLAKLDAAIYKDDKDKREAARVAEIAYYDAKASLEAEAAQGTKRTTGLIEQQRAEYERLQAQIKAANDAFNDQVNKILSLHDALDAAGLSPEERLKAEANTQKLIVEQEFKKLEDLAAAAGKQIDLSREKATILEEIDENLYRQLFALEEDFLERSKDLSADAARERKKFEEKAAKERIEAMGEAMRKGALAQKQIAETELSGLGKVFQSVKVKLADLFDLKNEDGTGVEEELNDILNSIGGSVVSIFDSMTEATNQAVEKNQELIDTLTEQEEAANENLEKELERQKLGLANNVEGEKKKIEAIKKQRAEAEKEEEKLRKRAVAQQILADSISQGSSIVTMATNIAAKTSLLGPAGIPVALATIAAFIAIISKIKASQKKLSGGGSLDQEGVTGFVNKSGRTDKAGGRGHRVEDSNVVLGGEEFVVAGGPAHEHAEFLQALNSNKFSGKDLMAEAASNGLHFALGNNREFEHNAAIISHLNSVNHNMVLASSIDASVSKHIGKLINVIENKAEAVAYTPGQLIRKEKKGNVEIIQTESDWRWKSDVFH